MPSTQSQKSDAPPHIETEQEYELAIERIEALWEAKAGSPEAEARDYLVSLVEEYEERYEDLG